MRTIYNSIHFTSLLRILGILVFSLLLFWNCDVKDSDVAPSATFTKVYESSNVLESYFPLDLIQTEDGGFLILSSLIDREQQSEIFYPRIHLTKTDDQGIFEWQQQLDNAYLSAVPKLIYANNQIFILCMKSLSSALLRVNLQEDGAAIEEIGTDGDRYYPLAAYIDNQTIITTSYYDRTSYVNAYDLNFNRQWSASGPSGEDIIPHIRKHLTKQGNELPFYIGMLKNEEKYFANIFHNYTLSLLFVSSGSINGYLYSYQDEGVISSCTHLEDSLFAISRYFARDNYVYPGVSINTNGLTNAKDFNDILMADLQFNARVQVIRDDFNGNDLILYASTTKTNQIALYFFDAITYEMLKSHFIGHTNPVEIASMIRAEDGALVILGKTWVSGRYQRNILYKLSIEELGF